jgi:hypothetical protein
MGKKLLLRLTLLMIVISVLALAHTYTLANTQTETLIKASLKAGLKSLGLSRLVADANRQGPPHDPPGPPCPVPPGSGCQVSPVR